MKNNCTFERLLEIDFVETLFIHYDYSYLDAAEKWEEVKESYMDDVFQSMSDLIIHHIAD